MTSAFEQVPNLRVWIDGAEVAPEDARVSVFDRGFLYGDSIFETLRTYDGAPFAAEQHLARLSRSAERVAIELPKTTAELEAELRRAAKASPYQESYLRLTVTRGVGPLGLDPALAKNPTRVLLVGPLEPPPPETYERGISVSVYRTQRVTDGAAAEGAKVGNYLTAVLAMREAKTKGAREALIARADGGIVEGATSNLFLVEGERLITPGEADGVLAGITREHLLDIARQLGLAVEFVVPDLARIVAADEVFVSSSIRELLPVVAVEGRSVGAGAPGPVTLRLLERFRASARASAAADRERFARL